MGLITKEVEVTLNGKNLKHFESLGYEIPRSVDKFNRTRIPKGTKITVKTKDLQLSSGARVDVECDGCFRILNWSYGDYTKCNHDGLTYCRSCGNKILHTGENHYLWNSNKTDEERNNERKYQEYTDFIKRVLDRDNYICQCCQKKLNHDAEVHHLDGYNWCVEKRTDDTNGITLCETCHKNFHSIYGYGNNTKQQFEEWIGRAIELLKYDGVLIPTKRIYCFENKKVYNSAEDVCIDLGINQTSQIYNVCKEYSHTANGYHFTWYDDFVNMSDSDIEEYLAKHQSDFKIRNHKVICLETKEVFNSMTEACKHYLGNEKNIASMIVACKELRTCLKDNKGNPLHWMYYEDYLEKIKKNEEIIFHKNKRTNKKVICTTTMKIFDSVTEGAKYYNTERSCVGSCCNGKQKTAGRLLDGTRLQWAFYEDYLKMKNIRKEGIDG